MQLSIGGFNSAIAKVEKRETKAKLWAWFIHVINLLTHIQSMQKIANAKRFIT